MKSVILLCFCVASIWAVPSLFKPTSIQRHPGGRIVGGDDAKPGQFPYQVAVYYDTNEGSFFCGGALIASNWVLTAGHCVYHATVFTLHLGSNNLVTADPNRVTVGASHSVLHPDYNPKTLENDIGLIRIDTKYEPNAAIATIPLGSSEVAGGVSVIVSGWGATGDWDGANPDLEYVALKTITNAECQAVYGDAIKDGMLCAVGPNNEGTCNGDTGSPLVVDDGNGNVVHVAVVTFVSGSGCETDHPSGYTRTAPYADWINKQIGA